MIRTTYKSRFPEIVAAMPIKVGAAIHHGTQAIADDAKVRAPVAAETIHFAKGDVPPGTLRDSIEARSGIDGLYGIYSAWYWRYPEFGTRYASAQPFLTPAAEAGKDDLVAGVRVALATL